MDCIFCKIKNKEMDSLILYEDDLIMIILDAFPNCDGHTLIIPKEHFTTFKDLPLELIEYIYKYAKIYTDVLMEKLNSNAMTLLANYGEAQVVKHFHLHLLPDFKGTPTLSREEVYRLIMEK